MFRCLALATSVAALPSYSSAFASTAGTSFVRQAHRGHYSTLSPRAGSAALAFFARADDQAKQASNESKRVSSARQAASSRSLHGGAGSNKNMALVMGLEVVPVIGGLEAAAALYAGHMPGVFVGAATVLWSTVLKMPISESAPIIKTVGGAFGSFLTFITVVMLGVRTYTAGADTRYIEGFPSSIAHPEGCTRVAAEDGNKGIAVPTFKASVPEVQATAKEWLESQPRTRIETETEGYVHAKSLSRLFGFPDSIGVKVFKNKSGKTEVWVQSELRVGQSDLDVNLKRMEALLGHLGRTLS